MATSSTLKSLKQLDGPIDVSDGPVRTSSNGLTDRLQTLWRSVWRRRWLSVVTAWLICAAGWAAITLWPTSFIASAVIYADLTELAGSKADTDGGPEQTSIALLKSMLASDAALAEVREEVPLDATSSQQLQNDIMVRSTVPPLFALAYEHQNPDVAQKVVETVIAGFEARLEKVTTTSLQEVQALEGEIGEREQSLQIAEADLAAFREGNDDYLSGTEGRAAELALLEEETTSLETKIQETTAERDDIATELAKARTPDTETADDNPQESVEEIEKERETLEAELAKLKERYADTHPYVNAVVDTINGLKAEALALAAPADDSGTTELLPADRERLEQRHEDLIAEVSTLSSQLGDKRREFEALQALTRTAGSVEAEFAELEAERETLRTALSDLQRRRDELGEINGGEAEQDPFRLIKPPELPTDPVGPSRLMALAAVFLGGTGVAALVAMVCNRFKGVFESAWQLRQRFDVGVLGTISEVMSPVERKRLGQSRLAFGLACLALVGVFSGLAVAELTDRLAPLGEQLRMRLLG
ncbi:MAG: hypothetical protein ACR2RA_16430 [Geminicoccaceae bacterium]